MNRSVVDRLLPLAESYALGRAEEKDLKRRMRGLEKCEKRHVGPGCHDIEGSDVNDLPRWCGPCRTREPLWKAFVDRRRKNRWLRQRLEFLGLKLSLPDEPDPPPERKELLEMMTTGETT